MNTKSNFTGNFTVDQHHNYHDLLQAQIAAISLSTVFGLLAAIFNSFLLFTLKRDPLKYFHRSASIVFIQGLALSDCISGVIIQPLYIVSLILEFIIGKVALLSTIAFVGSHVGAKVSILTLFVLSVGRLLAIALPLRYNRLMTRRRAVFTNAIVWVLVIVFEASHVYPPAENLLHHMDLHLQTTVPLFGLVIVFIATYLSFRSHSRSTVFVQNRISTPIRNRNYQFEKKLLITISLVLTIVLVSVLPYLTVQQASSHCHRDDGSHGDCDVDTSIEMLKILSVSLLCVSSVMNPVIYYWRVPHFRQSLKIIVCRRREPQNDEIVHASVPSALHVVPA